MVYLSTSPGLIRRALFNPSRCRARTNPMQTSRASPSGATSISRATQSVSGADEATYSSTSGKPVTSSRLVELSRCAAEGGERWLHDGGSVQFGRAVALTQGHPARPMKSTSYPSITKFQQLVELKDHPKPTKKEYVRYVRKLAEHFQCDPATLTEDQLRQYFLFLREHKH